MRLALFALMTLPAFAQPLRVYSEFAQLDSDGREASPVPAREILSPALARNAFASFQVAVRVQPGKRYFLYIHQNPEHALRITVYRQQSGRLSPILLPYYGSGSQVFWMDIWADRKLRVIRPVVEPQLRMDETEDNWYVYPMEVRLMDVNIPDGPWPEGSASPAAMMRTFACEDHLLSSSPAPHSVAALHFRNAQQDLALAAHVSKNDLRQIIGCTDSQQSRDPESYLHIRDYLLRQAGGELR